MPTNKRLNISLNTEDIQDLNKLRNYLSEIDQSETYSYVDVIRMLVKYGLNFPLQVSKSRHIPQL